MEGIIRSSEQPSSFVPPNNPAKGEWFWVDVAALAEAAGLPRDTPLVEVGALLVPQLIRGHWQRASWLTLGISSAGTGGWVCTQYMVETLHIR